MHLDTAVKNSVFGYHIQTRVFGNQLEKAIHSLNKALLLLLFAVYIYVYSAIGLLQQTITWYKIRHAGGQAHY